MIPLVTGTYITTSVVQSDNKIVLAGVTVAAVQKLTVARFNADGSADSSFAGTGNLTMSLPDNVDLVSAVNILPDGKLIIAGGAGINNMGHKPFTVRLLPDGSPDNTYGTNGINLVTDLGYSAFISDLATQTDGKTVAVLDHTNITTTSQFYVMRLLTNGSRDNTFGVNGVIQTPFTNISASRSLHIQDDGKIVVGGQESHVFLDQVKIALARYLTDGTPDNSFGTGGKVSVLHTFSLGIGWVNLTEQADHKLVIIASSKSAANAKYDFMVSRFDPDGTIDQGFGNTGYVLTDFDSIGNFPKDVFILGNGKILVTGYSSAPPIQPYTVMARYNSCGVSFTSQPTDTAQTEGSTAQFTVSTPSATATYQWQKETASAWESLTDGGQYSGTQTHTLTVLTLTLDNDEQRYRCLVFTGNCIDTSAVATLNVDEETAIIEITSGKGMKIFPNPAKDKLQVELTMKSQDATYIITDPVGREVLSGKLTHNENTIIVTSLTPGIYFLNIEHERTLKFIKD